MSKPKPRGDSQLPRATRKLRPRPTPKWLLQQKDLEEVARRRCLMVLTVLSGEKPVTEVIGEQQISRGTYYQLEERALKAMLRALSPGATVDGTEEASYTARIAALEERCRRLEQDKRRTERLLLLTRKVVRPGPVVTGAGRPPRSKGRRSTSVGTSASRSSTRPMATPAETATPTPTPGGETPR